MLEALDEEVEVEQDVQVAGWFLNRYSLNAVQATRQRLRAKRWNLQAMTFK